MCQAFGRHENGRVALVCGESANLSALLGELIQVGYLLARILEIANTTAEIVNSLRKVWTEEPQVGIILGTGLGPLADLVESPTVIAFSDVPHFPVSTAIGHKGQFVCGDLFGAKVIAMQGRFHLYEGYDVDHATLAIHVMGELGVKILFVSNASGGMNPKMKSGDIMLIESHIDLMKLSTIDGITSISMGITNSIE